VLDGLETKDKIKLAALCYIRFVEIRRLETGSGYAPLRGALKKIMFHIKAIKYPLAVPKELLVEQAQYETIRASEIR